MHVPGTASSIFQNVSRRILAGRLMRAVPASANRNIMILLVLQNWCFVEAQMTARAGVWDGGSGG